MRRLAGLVVVGMLLTTGLGCGGSGAPIEDAVVPVSGTVSYQGTPLSRYQVLFAPTDGRRPASGISDEQGHFVLSTNAEGDGAVPGSHRVTVFWAGPPPTDSTGAESPIEDPAKMPKQPLPVPAKYGDPEKSGLTETVPEDGTDQIKIDLP
jgi:hypothetical protein